MIERQILSPIPIPLALVVKDGVKQVLLNFGDARTAIRNMDLHLLFLELGQPDDQTAPLLRNGIAAHGFNRIAQRFSRTCSSMTRSPINSQEQFNLARGRGILANLAEIRLARGCRR